MTNYSEMSPHARFVMLDRLATQLFETERWKTLFADRYDVTRQAVGKWAHNGAPVWACVALEDALAAKTWQTVKDAVHMAEGKAVSDS